MSFQLHAWLDTALEAAILWILVKEFNYDKEKYERQAERNRSKKAKKDKDVDTASIPSSGGAQNVAMEPGQTRSPGAGEAGNIAMEMRDMRGCQGTGRLCDKARPETSKD